MENLLTNAEGFIFKGFKGVLYKTVDNCGKLPSGQAEKRLSKLKYQGCQGFQLFHRRMWIKLRTGRGIKGKKSRKALKYTCGEAVKNCSSKANKCYFMQKSTTNILLIFFKNREMRIGKSPSILACILKLVQTIIKVYNHTDPPLGRDRYEKSL